MDSKYKEALERAHSVIDNWDATMGTSGVIHPDNVKLLAQALLSMNAKIESYEKAHQIFKRHLVESDSQLTAPQSKYSSLEKRLADCESLHISEMDCINCMSCDNCYQDKRAYFNRHGKEGGK